MRVLLVHPSTKMIFITPRVIPLGIAYIAAMLEQSGHEVHVMDLHVENIDVESYLKNLDPEVVGIAVTTPLINEAWQISKKAKEILNNVTTVLGGPHVSVLPEESLSQPQVDVVVRGEGEETMVELCDKLDSGDSLDDVRGISYREPDGEIADNPDRPLIKDLDRLPFPSYHLFRYPRLYGPMHPLISDRVPAACILTSRGCPYNCNFCVKIPGRRGWRARSPGSVIEEWRWLIDTYHVKEIDVLDDLFTVNRRRVIDICGLLLKERLDIPWVLSGGVRADSVDRELLLTMKRAGCCHMCIGIESGNQRILNLIGKGEKLSEIERMVKNAKEVGLSVTGYFMIGNLGENQKTMLDTIRFAKKLDPDYCQFHIATPYPGSQLYDIVKKEGVLLPKGWDQFSYRETWAYFEHGEVTKELVENMLRRAYREFYLRPTFIVRQLMRGDLWNNVSGRVRGLLHLLT